MDLREIQRLAAAEINEDLYSLAAHGEDLLIERKAQIPKPERLGAEVASMANMLGGWLLLGVDDQTRKLETLRLKDGIDLQSHFGNLLRRAVDPVPAFLAGTLEVGDTYVGFVRVLPASVPVLVRGSGAVYTRDAGGKIRISDRRALLDLARLGRDAEDETRERPDLNQLTQILLGLPAQSTDSACFFGRWGWGMALFGFNLAVRRQADRESIPDASEDLTPLLSYEQVFVSLPASSFPAFRFELLALAGSMSPSRSLRCRAPARR
ncbi:MAG TPA: ATP-binding protein [Solirubrobacterales bacterium]|jgi:hypothetical protein